MWAGSGSPGHPSLQTSTELTSRSTQPELEVGARRGGACGRMVSLRTPGFLGWGPQAVGAGLSGLVELRRAPHWLRGRGET